MQKFRRFFVLLFILSLFVGVVHEAHHDHHDGTICEVCVLSHAPGLLNNHSVLVFIETFHLSFIIPYIAYPTLNSIQIRSRSPPIA